MNSKNLESADPRSASDTCRRPGFDKKLEFGQNIDEISQSQPPECTFILSCCIHHAYCRFLSLSIPTLLFFVLLMFIFLLILIYLLFLFLSALYMCFT